MHTNLKLSRSRKYIFGVAISCNILYILLLLSLYRGANDRGRTSIFFHEFFFRDPPLYAFTCGGSAFPYHKCILLTLHRVANFLVNLCVLLQQLSSPLIILGDFSILYSLWEDSTAKYFSKSQFTRLFTRSRKHHVNLPTILSYDSSPSVVFTSPRVVANKLYYHFVSCLIHLYNGNHSIHFILSLYHQIFLFHDTRNVYVGEFP